MLCVLTLASRSRASEVFKNFTEGQFDSSFSVDYFKTEANYSAEGATTALVNGNNFSIYDINFLGRYVLLTNFGIFSALNIGNAESSNAIATRKNSTLNNLTFGGDYMVYKQGVFSSYLDISYDLPLEKIKTDTDSALNNDGAGQLKISLTSVLDYAGYVPYGQIGLNYRTEGLSTLLTYRTGIEFRFEEPFALGLGLAGYVSVKDDAKTSAALERDNITQRVNAGSKRFYSVNPNSLDSDFYFKYIHDQDLTIKAGGGLTLIGSNSAQGYHAGFAILWSLGRKAFSNVVPQQKKAKPAAAPRFQEDTNDGVNQDYFKTVKPTKEEYVKPVDEESTIVTKPAVQKSTPRGNDKDYKIKLKKIRKKKSF